MPHAYAAAQPQFRLSFPDCDRCVACLANITATCTLLSLERKPVLQGSYGKVYDMTRHANDYSIIIVMIQERRETFLLPFHDKKSRSLFCSRIIREKGRYVKKRDVRKEEFSHSKLK